MNKSNQAGERAGAAWWTRGHNRDRHRMTGEDLNYDTSALAKMSAIGQISTARP